MFIRWFQMWMVPTGWKHFLPKRNRWKVYACCLQRSPCLASPSVFPIWLPIRLCAVEWGGKKEEKMENTGAASSRTTWCMLAGHSYANQNKLKFSLCVGSWARVLPWMKQMGSGTCTESPIMRKRSLSGLLPTALRSDLQVPNLIARCTRVLFLAAS